MLLTIVVAEDHDITRHGIGQLLSSSLGARVAAETDSGLDVVKLVQEHSPDLLITDLSLPGLNGLDLLRQLRGVNPHMKRVILSMHADDSYVVEALRLGADGYVLKGANASELLEAVRTVVSGRTYLSSSLPDVVRGENVHMDSPADRVDLLSDREREVLQLMAEGLTSREIGDSLFISHRTVEKHRQNMMAKLELNSIAGVVRFALGRGLIPMDSASAFSSTTRKEPR